METRIRKKNLRIIFLNMQNSTFAKKNSLIYKKIIFFDFALMYIYQKKQLVLKISELEIKFKTFINLPSYRYFCKVWRNIGEVVQKMVVFLVPMVHSQLYLTQGKPICIFFVYFTQPNIRAKIMIHSLVEICTLFA